MFRSAGNEPLEPVTLPACIVPDSKLNKRYGLPEKQRNSSPLLQQMAELKTWLTNAVQLDREGSYIGSRTLKNLVGDIYLFLGYLYFHEQAHSPQLDAFLSMQLFAKYIAFQLKKGNSLNSLQHQIAHAKRVIQFLSRRASSDMQTNVSSLLDWLQRLKAQLSTSLVRSRADVQQLEADGAWADARAIVVVLDAFRREVLRGLPEFGDLSVYAARLLHDACLVNTMFGYLPPVRIACLRKLQIPNAAQHCLDPDCRLPGCKGNRLELRPDGMWMVLPHHKNQRK